MPVLDVENMYKSFGNTKVLKGISFSMEKGKVLAVIGSSGSGKTTLLRCLNFLEKPDKGIVKINGKIIFDAKDLSTQKDSDIRKKRLNFGLVFQNFNLFPQYTVLKNITFASELLKKEELKEKKEYNKINYKINCEEIEKNAFDLLKQMNLLEKKDSYPHEISGGQQQRVAIARALALSPAILCFDEPTSALDPELTGEVLRVIRSLAQKHTTMIIVTHEMAFARDVADYVIFMDEGAIAEEGTPQQVINNPQNERTKQFLQRYSDN